MGTLLHAELVALFLALGVLLAAAHVLGELARRFGQPAVLGEIVTGVVLGPTVLGRVAPDVFTSLFPLTGAGAVVLDGLTTLSITLFLLVAGIEVDLSAVWRQGRAALAVAVLGMALPFAVGFAAATAAPEVLGRQAGADPLVFALFFSTALSISALPVIARTLLDLDLYRSPLGMLVMPAAVMQDVLGWLVFAVVLALMGITGALAVEVSIALTIGFAAFMLTAGRWAIDRALPWILAHSSFPRGVIGFALSLTLCGAAFTEWIGIHGIFGAFFVGIAIGDSKHLRTQVRFTIESFISFFFAPLFFASIGLRVDFVAHFSAPTVVAVFTLAVIGKYAGCLLGARLGGLPRREGWAVASAMNARGAMEIILGLLALQFGVIGDQLFVALVIMALATSMMSGPLIQRMVLQSRTRRFSDYLSAPRFLPTLSTADRHACIRELVERACPANLDREAVTELVLDHERLASTGIGNAVAVPHARIEGLPAPRVAVGLSRAGLDFDAPDGEPARIICLVLVPVGEDLAHLALLADISRAFSSPSVRELAVEARTYTEFLAALRTG